VAIQTAQRLGYEYVGKQLIAEIARELHISESEAEVFVRLLSKDDAKKIQEVMRNKNLDHDAATALIEKDEGDLREYIKHYFNEDWNNANLYDLIIDMEKNSVEKAVDLICDNVKHKAQ
jgi:cytidylate kinase